MNLDELEQEMLIFSSHSTDCYEADFCRKYIPRLIAVAKEAQSLINDWDGEGNPEHLVHALEELEKK